MSSREYINSTKSSRPGYLQRRMAIYRAQVQAEAERKAQAEKETADKVKPIKAAHG